MTRASEKLTVLGRELPARDRVRTCLGALHSFAKKLRVSRLVCERK